MTRGASGTAPSLLVWLASIVMAVGYAIMAAGSGAAGIVDAWQPIGFILAGLGEPGLPPGSLDYVYIPAFLGISLTSIFFAPIGARVAHRMPVGALKKVFAVFLLVLAAKLAYSL